MVLLGSNSPTGKLKGPIDYQIMITLGPKLTTAFGLSPMALKLFNRAWHGICMAVDKLFGSQ